MSTASIPRAELLRIMSSFRMPPEFRVESDPQTKCTIEHLVSFVRRRCVFYVVNGKESAVVPAEIANVNLELRANRAEVVIKLYIGSLFDRDVEELVWNDTDGWKIRLFANASDGEQTKRLTFLLNYFEVLP